MNKARKLIIATLLLVVLSGTNLFSNTSTDSLLVQGLEAYRKNDWVTSLFFLRKAVSLPENSTPETWYVLIMSEVFAEDYESVLTDGKYFLTKFPQSTYVPQIEYQMARALFNIGKYQESINSFTLFCDKYPKQQLVSSALFWIGESLYQTYNYEGAKKVFEKILENYPSSSKIVEVVFRLELLNQRQREEKLLYLLKVTGEEYLASREEYERQLKQYQTEDAMNLRKVVSELNNQIDELTIKLSDTQTKNDELAEEAENLLKQTQEMAIKLEQNTILNKTQDVNNKEHKSDLIIKDPSVLNQNENTTIDSNVPSTVTSTTDEDADISKELEMLKQKALRLEELLEGVN